MKKSIILLALAFVGVACSESNGGAEDNRKSVSLTVAMDGDYDEIMSRVGVDTSVTNWKFSWEEDDTLTAIDQNGETSTFVIDQFSASAATFKGSVDTGAEKIKLIYPAIEGTTIDLAEQAGDFAKTYMINDDWVSVVGGSENSYAPVMKHLGGYMVVAANITNVTDEKAAYKLRSVEYSGLPTSATIDITKGFDEALTCGENGTIKVTLAEPIAPEVADSFAANVYFNILPFDFVSGESLTAKLNFATDTGIPFTFEKVIANNSGATMSFKRAKYNTTNVDCDMSTIAVVNSIVSKFNYSPKEYTFVIGGDDNSTSVPTITYNTGINVAYLPTSSKFSLLSNQDLFTIDSATGVVSLMDGATPSETAYTPKVRVESYYEGYDESAYKYTSDKMLSITISEDGGDVTPPTPSEFTPDNTFVTFTPSTVYIKNDGSLVDESGASVTLTHTFADASYYFHGTPNKTIADNPATDIVEVVKNSTANSYISKLTDDDGFTFNVTKIAELTKGTELIPVVKVYENVGDKVVADSSRLPIRFIKYE